MLPVDLGGFSSGRGYSERGWDVRRIDYHCHSILAVLVFGLRAVEVDGVGAVHGDLEYGFLICR